MEEYTRLKELVASAEEDVAKATGATRPLERVRKAMQDIKDTAQAVRKKILEVRATQPE